MFQDDNEIEFSLYLDYNLSTGFLHQYEVETPSLQKLSIMSAIVSAFNCDEAVEEIRNLNFDDDQENANLVRVVKNKVGVTKLPNSLRRRVEADCRLIYIEIIDFLSSISPQYRSFFFGNIVFNCQGVVNPRETVLKILSCNSLSVNTKFVFSCLYLFDRDIIATYYHYLSPEDQYIYHDQNYYGLPALLIFYWTARIHRNPERPADLQQITDHEILSSAFFLYYIDSEFCTQIGTQYLFEHLTPSNCVLSQAIRNLFRKPKNHRFNICMYLIFQILKYRMFCKYSYEILTNFIKNSRWQDCFLLYFSILRFNVGRNKYMPLLNTVITETEFMIRIEGVCGEFYYILEDFIILIPSVVKKYLERMHRRDYANIVFTLFKYHDFQLINSLLFTNEENENIGDKFYELTKAYPDLIKTTYRPYSTCDESFLNKVISSEEIFLDLLTRLRFSIPLHLADMHNRSMVFHAHICVIRLKWHYLFPENCEFIRNLMVTPSLNALRKIEYAEQFLSFVCRKNKIQICFKKRIMFIIN
ncbi:UNVERIFIED_CONTAM: hypothetical protein RMT77_019702 [Armadillidium vulgare]|nr:hypothetical protein Avbf_12654 [Armadillidium vulgare]